MLSEKMSVLMDQPAKVVLEVWWMIFAFNKQTSRLVLRKVDHLVALEVVNQGVVVDVVTTFFLSML